MRNVKNGASVWLMTPLSKGSGVFMLMSSLLHYDLTSKAVPHSVTLATQYLTPMQTQRMACIFLCCPCMRRLSNLSPIAS